MPQSVETQFIQNHNSDAKFLSGYQVGYNDRRGVRFVGQPSEWDDDLDRQVPPIISEQEAKALTLDQIRNQAFLVRLSDGCYIQLDHWEQCRKGSSGGIVSPDYPRLTAGAQAISVYYSLPAKYRYSCFFLHIERGYPWTPETRNICVYLGMSRTLSATINVIGRDEPVSHVQGQDPLPCISAQ